jgi:flagellar biosynthesis GTPase FlhF
MKKEYRHKKEMLVYNDANDFKDNELNESIINQIEDNQYDKRIISLIEGEEDCWEYKLSQQEKNYVKNSDTFILSGRPGTGKTTVILFKLFSIYFNSTVQVRPGVPMFRKTVFINLARFKQI